MSLLWNRQSDLRVGIVHVMPKAVGLSYIFPAVPILSIIGVALLLLVLPGFWKTRNVALLSYISVCIYLNLKAFIDSLIWRNSIKNIAPIYCDISMSRVSANFKALILPTTAGLLTLQANIFIPAAIVCISRFIWLISTSSPYVVVHDQVLRFRFETCSSLLNSFHSEGKL